MGLPPGGVLAGGSPGAWRPAQCRVSVGDRRRMAIHLCGILGNRPELATALDEARTKLTAAAVRQRDARGENPCRRADPAAGMIFFA